MCFHLWFQISVFNGSQNLCNDFIIVSIKHDKTNPRVKKNTTLGWVLMLFPRRHRPFQKNTKIGKKPVAMETGPHHDYVLEVVVWNVWGSVMGDGTLSAPHVSFSKAAASGSH